MVDWNGDSKVLSHLLGLEAIKKRRGSFLHQYHNPEKIVRETLSNNVDLYRPDGYKKHKDYENLILHQTSFQAIFHFS